MKIALMILFVVGGMSMTSSIAQSCAPCPPGCCKVVSCEPGKGSASVGQDAVVQNALVAFSPEAMANSSQGKKMSKQEMKACQAACQPICAPAPAKVSQVATSAPVACQPSPTPAAQSKPVKM